MIYLPWHIRTDSIRFRQKTNNQPSGSISVPHRGTIESYGRKRALIFLGRISFWFSGPPERTLMREQWRKGGRWIGDENELSEWTRSAPEWREASNFDESGLGPSIALVLRFGITNVIKLMRMRVCVCNSRFWWRPAIDPRLRVRVRQLLPCYRFKNILYGVVQSKFHMQNLISHMCWYSESSTLKVLQGICKDVIVTLKYLSRYKLCQSTLCLFSLDRSLQI